MQRFLTFLALLAATTGAGNPASAATAIPEDKYSAVVLVYHRIGEDAYPDSNLRTEQFMDHLQEIASADYTVLPLSEIIDAVKNHRELPPRALAITFENAYRSALDNAIPALLEKNIPFTVFYSSGQLDAKTAENMSWQELKKLAQNQNVSIGVLPAAYSNLAREPEDEIRRQVNKALLRYREEFGSEPTFFSYPFGEYSLPYKKIIADSGFTAAFGLHSGTVYEGADFFALPRFTMTERFGDTERFRLVVNALPLPAIDIEPRDPQIGGAAPSIGFSLPPSLENESADLSCFVSGRGQPEIERLGNRIELRLADIPGDERVRLNCTMPGPMDTQTDVEQWRWLGMVLAGQSVPAPERTTEETNPPPDGPQ
ncbi:MAG TPA: polysaccharide deacetylase family protein [Alphaproteobacteria bacterium]|nr:polysaccharide deacetylase family protein [Micavibrio sp.]HQX28028.1 polysaccharide deacetylase family protein [Alphaproteobacteria bacterium]